MKSGGSRTHAHVKHSGAQSAALGYLKTLSAQDIKVGKGSAWRALADMKKV